jgi:hypothetical protein
MHLLQHICSFGMIVLQSLTIASVNNENLELPEKLPIEELAKQAFSKLGNGGIIRIPIGLPSDSSDSIRLP